MPAFRDNTLLRVKGQGVDEHRRCGTHAACLRCGKPVAPNFLLHVRYFCAARGSALLDSEVRPGAALDAACFSTGQRSNASAIAVMKMYRDFPERGVSNWRSILRLDTATALGFP